MRTTGAARAYPPPCAEFAELGGNYVSATSLATVPEWLSDIPRGSEESASSKLERSRGELPDIRVNGRELREISAEALEAVVAANDPAKLFARAGSVVRVDQAEDGRPVIIGLTD